MKYINNYFNELKETRDKVSHEEIEKVINVLFDAYQKNQQIFIMGNGGSASLASHFATDLGKGTLNRCYEDKKRFKVISLTDNVAILTAYANDLNFEDCFAQQLRNLVIPKDIVLAITGSGNSKNVLKAIDYASKSNAITIGFTGFDGGKLKSIVDYSINVPSQNYGIIEDIHTNLTHLISLRLSELKQNDVNL